MSLREAIIRREADVRDVFISYAGLDRDVAAALAADLEAANVGVWWDAHLAEDEPFEQQIQRMIAEAKVIVAVLSPQALASEWVRWELSQAVQNGLHLLPLLVNGVRPEHLPPPLHLLSSLSLAGDERTTFMHGIAAQIRELVATIKRRPSQQKENDARRRLASAAARTARQAANIKYRKSRALPRPSIVVRGCEQSAGEYASAVQFSTSDGLASFLRDENISVAFTSFKTDELFLLGHTDSGELTVDIQAFRKPTGLYVGQSTLLLGTLAHLYRIENILRPGQRLDDIYSHCYLPRISLLTGVVDTHDVGMTSADEIVFVATRYNCLATISSVHSFKPLWRPYFISEIVAEDRCHLNGLAMRDGVPAYVTAVAPSNVYDGWRDRAADGGIVLDVETNTIVCSGLSMPHSPRLHQGELWVLNSGAGELGCIDLSETAQANYRAIAFCPGFARGLAFHRHYALVGVSHPRYDDFDGLPLAQRLREAHTETWCGIRIIDTTSGQCVHWFQLNRPAMELYDVAVLPDVVCPRSVGAMDDEAFDLVTIEDCDDENTLTMGVRSR